MKATLELTKEEEALAKQPIQFEGKKRVVERLLSRKQVKKNYEYEVKWDGEDHSNNCFLSKDMLMQLGFDKLMQHVGEREAQSAGAFNRPLTQQMIEKHCNDVGLETEFVVHSQIQSLSGGQWVKVVLGAAVWINPTPPFSSSPPIIWTVTPWLLLPMPSVSSAVVSCWCPITWISPPHFALRSGSLTEVVCMPSVPLTSISRARPTSRRSRRRWLTVLVTPSRLRRRRRR